MIVVQVVMDGMGSGSGDSGSDINGPNNGSGATDPRTRPRISKHWFDSEGKLERTTGD